MRAWVFRTIYKCFTASAVFNRYPSKIVFSAIPVGDHPCLAPRPMLLHNTSHYTQEVGEDFRTSLDGRIERALSQQAWQALAQVLQTRSDSKVRHGKIRLTATAEPSPCKLLTNVLFFTFVV